MAAPLFCVLGGFLLLAISAWGWRGRSRAARWWVPGSWGRETMLGIIPGLGMIILCGGLLTAGREISEDMFGVVTLLSALPMLLGFILEFAGLLGVLPRWWAPGWYREMSEEERLVGGHDPFHAAMFELSTRPDINSVKEVRARYGDSRPVGSYSGGWVFDPDSRQREHGLARKGAVDGHVTVYRGGIVFAASRAEDALRGKGTVLDIDMDDVVGVRVVPARARADGKRRKGVLYRSIFPRLVVATVNGDYIFDFPWARAKRVAEQLVPLIPDGR